MKPRFVNKMSKSQVDKLAEGDKMALGEKFVSHAKGPMFDAVEYKRYVVNDLLYRTLN
jgi:F420-0:gamma-glutamyl ligase-like protein